MWQPHLQDELVAPAHAFTLREQQEQHPSQRTAVRACLDESLSAYACKLQPPSAPPWPEHALPS